MDISLFVAGDVVPYGIRPEDFYNKRNQIFYEVQPYIERVDCSIINLEAPVVKGKPTPIKKSGPCLSLDPTAVMALKDVGFDVFTLANNHFYDQGQRGVDNTIDACNSHSVSFVGGGRSLSEARKPLYLDIKSKRVAIINVCENEFSVADLDHGGSNPLDLINMQEDITYANKDSDYVVVIIHGGVELYNYPTPRMKRWYHHFIDLGADVIVNHHQHCINGYEVYKGKPIFYGLGNFYFPSRTNKSLSWRFGYALTITLGESIGFEFIPFEQNAESIHLQDSCDFKKTIEQISLPIADDFLLQQKFDEHILNCEYSLKSQLLPSLLKGRVLSFFAIRGYLGKLYNENQSLNIKNKLTCETHHESLQRLFALLIK